MAVGFGGVFLLFNLPNMLPAAVANEEPARTLLSSASEIFPPAFDPSKLLKFDYELEPAVSTTVLSQSTVRKIGYGRTEFVQVVETPTGTYSTDALQSPYVEYPGVLKTPVRGKVGLAVWSNGRWRMETPVAAGSFVTITKFDGGQLLVTDDTMCVTTASSVSCR